MQKPSKGRIVLVLVDPSTNGDEDTAPAVITRVWSDEQVNVRVLHDAEPLLPADQYRQDWLTSVPLAESREALDEAHKAQWGSDEAATFGAFWPPRV